jgi:hypothetical protein
MQQVVFACFDDDDDDREKKKKKRMKMRMKKKQTWLSSWLLSR